MNSSRLQKQHFKLPFHHFFAKLSLVNATPLIKYQINFFTFMGNLSFQMIWLWGIPLGTTNTLYIEWIVNFPSCCTTHLNLYFWPVSWTSLSIATIVCQAIRLLPTKYRLKETFNESVLSTYATVALFFLTISYSVHIPTYK
jgi:hypothetical protein